MFGIKRLEKTVTRLSSKMLEVEKKLACTKHVFRFHGVSVSDQDLGMFLAYFHTMSEKAKKEFYYYRVKFQFFCACGQGKKLSWQQLSKEQQASFTTLGLKPTMEWAEDRAKLKNL